MGDGIGDFAFWLAIGGASLGLFMGPIGRAVGRWIERWGPHREAGGEAVRILAGRVAELEERLDFTERMLARQDEPARIQGADDEHG